MNENTPEEMVAAWDRGDLVPSIELGGLGPSYEQTIQILVIELLRSAGPPPSGIHLGAWGEEVVARLAPSLGFSGAQVGVAKSFAAAVFQQGFQALKEQVDKDRLILISKDFPKAPEAP